MKEDGSSLTVLESQSGKCWMLSEARSRTTRRYYLNDSISARFGTQTAARSRRKRESRLTSSTVPYRFTDNMKVEGLFDTPPIL